ncbi:MAG: hypothetical protein AMDU1_APLC00009G0029 [Thermoplasmatales archaeon A-plasma]|nr:MAG: hypothetical protein AMDU1_APLC00009G0029 [Thermoplasmatales archaeon A-plasma]
MIFSGQAACTIFVVLSNFNSHFRKFLYTHGQILNHSIVDSWILYRSFNSLILRLSEIARGYFAVFFIISKMKIFPASSAGFKGKYLPCSQ